MEFKQIQELVKSINKSSISELSIEQGDFKITIKQDFSGNQPQYVMAAPSAPTYSAAPMPIQAPVAETVAQPAPAAAPQAAPASSNGNQITIKSPMIGTFYRSPSPDKPVFVNVGDEIKQGQVLCIIEAMKLFNEIECEMNCRVIKVLADDSSPVEYDQPLFLVEPI